MQKFHCKYLCKWTLNSTCFITAPSLLKIWCVVSQDPLTRDTHQNTDQRPSWPTDRLPSLPLVKQCYEWGSGHFLCRNPSLKPLAQDYYSITTPGHNITHNSSVTQPLPILYHILKILSFGPVFANTQLLKLLLTLLAKM